MYDLYASDFHRPRIRISASDIPAWAAEIAAPLRNECSFYVLGLRPAIRARCWSFDKTYSREKGLWLLVCWPTQKSGAVAGLWVSLSWNSFMASTGHPSSWVAAMVSLIPFRKGSVFEASRVNSM